MVDALVHKLFEAEHRRLDKIIQELVETNSRLKGSTCYGFMYQGIRYIPQVHMNKLGMLKGLPNLHFTLGSQVMVFISDANKIKNDFTRIKQLLVYLVRNAHSVQDLRDALPECIVALTNFKSLNRTVADPIDLIDDPHQRETYNKLLPIIEMYSVTCLLY